MKLSGGIVHPAALENVEMYCSDTPFDGSMYNVFGTYPDGSKIYGPTNSVRKVAVSMWNSLFAKEGES